AQPCQAPISDATQGPSTTKQPIIESTQDTQHAPTDPQSDVEDDDQEYLPSLAILEKLVKDPAILTALQDPIVRTLIPEIINNENSLALLEEVIKDIPAFDKFKVQLLDFVKSVKES
ncbi:hypothetical protein IWQ61_010462, partial [Dispira simplex]